MKELKIFTVLILLILSCCSCGLIKETDTYKDRIDEINAIEIVELGEYDSKTYSFNKTSLCKISNTDNFVKELLNIKCKTHWSDPNQLDTGDIVIKIIYNNKDFDLLGWQAQLKNRSGKNNYGYMIFDEEQFNSLIATYTENVNN